MTHEFVLVFAALFGATIGSFINVVIWRLPRGESLSKEGSHCPKCGAKIRWYDNVPVLGWLVLRGRCRACRAGISPRYPIVEALCAALFVAVALRHDPREELAIAIAKSALLASLVAIAFIDHDQRIIPDRIVRPGAVIGLVVAFLVTGWAPDAFLAAYENRHVAGLLRALAGAACGAGTLLAIRWIGALLLKKEVMGLGDVKLMAMVGAFTGPIETFLVIFLGSLSGAILGGVLVAVRARGFVAVPAAFVEAAAKKGEPARTPVPLRVRAPRTGPITIELRPAADAAPAGEGERTLSIAFPPESVWHDGTAPVVVSVRVREAAGAASGVHRFEVLTPSEGDEETLTTYCLYRKSVPFGVFLSIGAAVVVVWGAQVSQFVFETWPRWITGGRSV